VTEHATELFATIGDLYCERVLDAHGAPPHVFIVERTRDIVRSTRRTKHGELTQAVGQFTSRFTNLIMRIIRLQSAGRNSFLEIGTLFRSLSDEDRQKLTREILRSVFPLRIDLLDPSKVFLTERSERRETPVDVHTTNPTRNERLQSAIRSALEEAFAISSKDVVDHLERLVKDSLTNSTALGVASVR
jgi:hypothetical protein